nr:reverse transcriptase domain-containing protein [Tanacetum cinerariifolium]
MPVIQPTMQIGQPVLSVNQQAQPVLPSGQPRGLSGPIAQPRNIGHASPLEFCPSLEMQKLETKLWNHAMVGAGHAAYINRFHELARLIHGMVAATEPTMILSVVLKVGVLIDEAIRNGSIKKNLRREEMRENLARIRIFVSTTFLPLLGIKPSEIGFIYEIEIASGQLVEIDKVIKGCKLEIKGCVFNIDLILFGRGSFDVIIVLRVLGERPEDKARLSISVKASDKKQKEIVVVRDFPEIVRVSSYFFHCIFASLKSSNGATSASGAYDDNYVHRNDSLIVDDDNDDELVDSGKSRWVHGTRHVNDVIAISVSVFRVGFIDCFDD